MKATEQYFPVVLFIVLYNVVLTFESVDKILNVTIQMKKKKKVLCRSFLWCPGKTGNLPG